MAGARAIAGLPASASRAAAVCGFGAYVATVANGALSTSTSAVATDYAEEGFATVCSETRSRNAWAWTWR